MARARTRAHTRQRSSARAWSSTPVPPASVAKYCMAFLVVSVLPAPDSPTHAPTSTTGVGQAAHARAPPACAFACRLVSAQADLAAVGRVTLRAPSCLGAAGTLAGCWPGQRRMAGRTVDDEALAGLFPQHAAEGVGRHQVDVRRHVGRVHHVARARCAQHVWATAALVARVTRRHGWLAWSARVFMSSLPLIAAPRRRTPAAGHRLVRCLLPRGCPLPFCPHALRRVSFAPDRSSNLGCRWTTLATSGATSHVCLTGQGWGQPYPAHREPYPAHRAGRRVVPGPPSPTLGPPLQSAAPSHLPPAPGTPCAPTLVGVGHL